jgi:hypothetical protein
MFGVFFLPSVSAESCKTESSIFRQARSGKSCVNIETRREAFNYAKFITRTTEKIIKSSPEDLSSRCGVDGEKLAKEKSKKS